MKSKPGFSDKQENLEGLIEAPWSKTSASSAGSLQEIRDREESCHFLKHSLPHSPAITAREMRGLFLFKYPFTKNQHNRCRIHPTSGRVAQRIAQKPPLLGAAPVRFSHRPPVISNTCQTLNVCASGIWHKFDRGGVVYPPNLLVGEFRGQAGIPYCHLYVHVPLAVLQRRGTLTTH